MTYYALACVTHQQANTLSNNNISWRGDVPASDVFDDVYYSVHDGLAESRHVFLGQNHIAERVANCHNFTIAETGFGTGLNLLAAWQCFAQHAPSNACLHFVSVEKFPLAVESLNRALSAWPELDEYRHALVENYPPSTPGFHHRQLSIPGKPTVKLTLIFADCLQAYNQLEADIDAWFLDGFAPSKNPEMWTHGLFHTMARLSKPGGTFGTFTAAGFVRRGLAQAGWTVTKQPGIGHKREICGGQLAEPPSPRSIAKPWFQWPAPAPLASPQQHHPEVVVIGAGIAGCATAYSLAQRGCTVRLLDQGGIADGASGIPAGIMRPHPDVGQSLGAELLAQGFAYAERLVHQLVGDGHDIPMNIGAKVIQRGVSSNGVAELQQQNLPNAEFDDAGMRLTNALSLRPADLCAALLEQAGITCEALRVTHLEKQTAEHIGHNEAADHAWKITAQDEGSEAGNNGRECHTFTTSNVVLATGAGFALWPALAELGLEKVRGQLTLFNSELPLNEALNYGGYFCPPTASTPHHACGSSFVRGDESLALRDDEHQANLAKLEQALQHLGLSHSASVDGGYVGTRVSSPDHLPLVGAMPDLSAWREDYDGIHQPWPAHEKYPAPRFETGLYLNTAHGSKGLATALLSGEIVAAQLTGTPSPIGQHLHPHLSPGRYLIRQLRRKNGK